MGSEITRQAEEKRKGMENSNPAVSQFINERFSKINSEDPLAKKHKKNAQNFILEYANDKSTDAYQKLCLLMRMERARMDTGKGDPSAVFYAGLDNQGEVFVSMNQNEIGSDRTVLFTGSFKKNFGSYRLDVKAAECDASSGFFTVLDRLANIEVDNNQYAEMAREILRGAPSSQLGLMKMPAEKIGVVEKLIGPEGTFEEIPAIFINYATGEAIPLPLYLKKKGSEIIVLDLFSETKWGGNSVDAAVKSLAQSTFLPYGAIYYKSKSGVKAVEAVPKEWLQYGDNIAMGCGYVSLALAIAPEVTVTKVGSAITGYPAMGWFSFRAMQHFYEKAVHKKEYFNPAEIEDWRSLGILLANVIVKGKVPKIARISGIGMLIGSDFATAAVLYKRIDEAQTPEQKEKAAAELRNFLLLNGGITAAIIGTGIYRRRAGARALSTTKRLQLVEVSITEVSKIQNSMLKNLKTYCAEIEKRISDSAKKKGVEIDESMVSREVLQLSNKAVAQLGRAADMIREGGRELSMGIMTEKGNAYIIFESGYNWLRQRGFSEAFSKSFALLNASHETKYYTYPGHSRRPSVLLEHILMETTGKGNDGAFIHHDAGKAVLPKGGLHSRSALNEIGKVSGGPSIGIEVGIMHAHVLSIDIILDSLRRSGLMTRSDVALFDIHLRKRIPHHPYDASFERMDPMRQAAVTFADALDTTIFRVYDSPKLAFEIAKGLADPFGPRNEFCKALRNGYPNEKMFSTRHQLLFKSLNGFNLQNDGFMRMLFGPEYATNPVLNQKAFSALISEANQMKVGIGKSPGQSILGGDALVAKVHAYLEFFKNKDAMPITHAENTRVVMQFWLTSILEPLEAMKSNPIFKSKELSIAAKRAS
ncbi:hypothetical protein KJ780_01310 [Candidatus Micrarchaeota archaeon]|nr:hypothetical protein [Candidatus Micrarchaeota archaeon]